MKSLRLCFALLFIICLTNLGFSQTGNATQETLRIFIDCNYCDRSYIKQEINFINYVRDKEDSDVHLLITRQQTGSGGTEYTMRFLGSSSPFNTIKDTLKYISASSDTQEEERSGLVRIVKLGLVPFLSETQLVNELNVNYEGSGEEQTLNQDDKWNYWVFEVQGDTYFNGEESSSRLYLSVGGSADRVTPDWKINLDYEYDFNKRTFTELDSVGNKSTTEFITRGQRFDGLVLKSLSDHWSAGIYGEAYSSTRNNIDLSTSISPAIEYNIFPYEEYSTREISFKYLVKAGYFDYDEITIFNKREDFLVHQQLQGRVNFTQEWGEIEGRLNASTYLQDLSKNRLETRLEVDFRIFRGLSLTVSGRYSVINDQLSIPKGDISDAEQLLDLRQQATSYSYSGSVGIEYSFGSIYNNVVNPRF